MQLELVQADHRANELSKLMEMIRIGLKDRISQSNGAFFVARFYKLHLWRRDMLIYLLSDSVCKEIV